MAGAAATGSLGLCGVNWRRHAAVAQAVRSAAEASRVRGADAEPEHHDLSIRAARASFESGGAGGRGLAEPAERRACSRASRRAARRSCRMWSSMEDMRCAPASSTSARRTQTSRRCRRSSRRSAEAWTRQRPTRIKIPATSASKVIKIGGSGSATRPLRAERINHTARAIIPALLFNV